MTEELVGKLVKIPKCLPEKGLERIILVSRRISRAIKIEGDYKVIFEEEPEKTYLWSEVKKYQPSEKCASGKCESGYRILNVANGWQQVVPYPIPFDGRWH